MFGSTWYFKKKKKKKVSQNHIPFQKGILCIRSSRVFPKQKIDSNSSDVRV